MTAATEPAAVVDRGVVWRGRLVRAGSGLAVAGVVAAVVVAGGVVPGTAVDGLGPSSVPVPPAATTLVCAGPLLLPDDVGRGDSAFDPTPVDPVSSVSVASSTRGAGTVTTLDGAQTLARLDPGDEAVTVGQVPAPLVVRAEPGDTAPARVGAVSSGLVTAGDLRGLSAASCQHPTADAWLVGGATDLTSTAQLVLTNAGSTPAEVGLEVWGPSGAVDLTGERYLVAPGAQRVVAVGGIAAEQRRLVVHVATTGGRVAVHLQDSALDGFTPAGTDLVVPGEAPARRQVVPGVSVVASEVGDEDAGAVRLLVPGDATATASVSVLGPDGPTALPGAESVELRPGEVTDVPLGGLAAGTYTLLVDADQPVVAAAVVTRPGSPGELDDVPSRERAWAASSSPTDGGVAVLPAGTGGTFTLAGLPARGSAADSVDGGGETTATVRLLGDDGRVVGERRVSVPVGATGAWSLEALVQGDGLVTPSTALTAPAGQPVVRAVDVVVDDGDDVAWALVAEVSRPDGVLVSVLRPVPALVRAPDVAVQPDPRLGTR
ncbi:hypothetical protein GXP71_09630 [Cellulomonas sp. H30R-01]|uniref:DUF5719 family protein n=1 Tax=Cellulomonas sp. H30R-01 TaxID=2704467 RepID=UPI00138D04E3|nr:DUF5719 family protein [Cellulomonas sp. H30R-01]QHT56311.1 hypothetical protein GXP71_09630 [Cellulomonas sp. H30R-01]